MTARTQQDRKSNIIMQENICRTLYTVRIIVHRVVQNLRWSIPQIKEQKRVAMLEKLLKFILKFAIIYTTFFQ